MIKGLNLAESNLLELLFALKPWGNDRISRKVAAFLDGDQTALDQAPALKERLMGLIEETEQ